MRVGERVTWGGVVWECVHEGRSASAGEWCWSANMGMTTFPFWTIDHYPILRPVAIAGQEGYNGAGKPDGVSDWLRGFHDAVVCMRAEVECQSATTTPSSSSTATTSLGTSSQP